MADIQHVDITDPQIHEPKGASTASAGTVYVSDGTGSGAWQVLALSSLNWPAVQAEIQTDLTSGDLEVVGDLYLTAVIEDISTAGSVIIPVPDSCTVVGASVVLGGPITVADAVISFKNSAGAGMGTSVTVPFSSSGKGDQYSFTATGNNVLVGPTWIEVETDGGSTDAQPLFITVKLRKQLNT